MCACAHRCQRTTLWTQFSHLCKGMGSGTPTQGVGNVQQGLLPPEPSHQPLLALKPVMYLCVWVPVAYETHLLPGSSVSLGLAQSSALLAVPEDACLFAISLSHVPGQALLAASPSVMGDVPGLCPPCLPSLFTPFQLEVREAAGTGGDSRCHHGKVKQGAGRDTQRLASLMALSVCAHELL